MANRRFAGQVAVVTGGARGIGKAVAERLRDEGAQLVIVDQDAAELERVEPEFPGATLVACDVSQEEAVRGYVDKALSAYGRVDCFFNNAGIEGRIAPITELEMEDFDRVMHVNVRGVFLGLREVLRVLKRQGTGGAIVNTASMAGIRGGRNISPYVASKHAVIGLTRCAALEGAAYGVRVNAVAPGYINTRLLRSINQQTSPGDPEEAMRERAARVPWKRYGTPEEVANLVVWLLSSEASYVTGATVLIDGGQSA